MGLLDGQVAIVTGAGQGLGRAHALALSAEGAAVVVNDPGVQRDGSGGGAPFAEEVAKEITAAGGKAVANLDSVATRDGAQAIVQSALDTFGRLDILVNNAGILRDRTLAKMTDEEFDAVMVVHAYGTYFCTHAAATVMRKAGNGGRIINTSSYAGLIGNFGQSNYAMAKAGIAGFTRTVALELRRAKITVNAIAPIAKTRMTEDIAAVPADVTPEQIAPFVVYLASGLAEAVTGRTFGVHGPHVFEYKMVMTPGAKKDDGLWTASELAERIEEISAVPSAKAPATDSGSGPSNAEITDQVILRIGEGYKAEAAGSWAAVLKFVVEGAGEWTVDVANGAATSARGVTKTPTCTIKFDSAETFVGIVKGKVKPEAAFMSGQLSATDMGVLMKFAQYFDLTKGAKALSGDGDKSGESKTAKAKRPAGLNAEMLGRPHRGSAAFAQPEAIEAYAQATGETNPLFRASAGDDQIAPPLFPVVPVFRPMSGLVTDPELGADLLRLVHGEQDLRIHRPIRAWELLYPTATLETIEQKSSGELLTCRQQLFSAGELVAEIESGMFIRGPRRSDGASSKPAAPEPPPPPSRTATVTIPSDQPARYAEASGDRNPIHVNERAAQSAGHPSVILHGLATMAHASRELVAAFANGNSEALRRIKVRFSGVVLPNDELELLMWAAEPTETGNRCVTFEMRNAAGKAVLSQGLAEFS